VAGSGTPKGGQRRSASTDLGVLAGRLLFSVQNELYRELRELGFDDIAPRHGVVFAYLPADGIRATELARLSGQHKQVIGKSIDELEALGYVERRPDPGDRRAKLVAPTSRGLAQIRASDMIMAEIGERHRRWLGAKTYATFLADFHRVVDRQWQALR
jgi:DNA-binding MarR family transcriptional regulator